MQKKITDTKIDGELLDIHIAAKVYKISFAIYLDEFPTMPLSIVTPNSVKTLNLYLNQEGTYDLVLMKESLKTISICQAILYEMLYNHVFKLSNVQFAVTEMLFDRHFACLKITDHASLEKRATCTDMKELLELGITPFPFKVAKALTPKLYRNTEYDIWLNSKKEKFFGKCNNFEFKEGSKCMVVIDNQEYHCYIQHIRGKNEPVEVYVKHLAQKIDVEFNQLKLMSVEEDVKQSIDSPTEVSQISSTAVGGNGFLFQLNGQCETPFQFNNSCFIQDPETHVIMPGQVFPPSYMNQQQPWYMTRHPPTLPNETIPFKDQIVMFGMSDSLNQNCILQSNFIDSSKVVGPLFQSIFPPWYNDHQPNTSCKCMQCNNSEGSSLTMNSIHVNQPWQVPKFDLPDNKLQQ